MFIEKTEYREYEPEVLQNYLKNVDYFEVTERRKVVLVESPYFNADIRIMKENIEYARKCLVDCLNRYESPIATHLLYTQFLDDRNQEQRDNGIDAGLEIGLVCDKTVVYLDRGISSGMAKGIEHAIRNNRIVEYRYLDRRIEIKNNILFTNPTI